MGEQQKYVRAFIGNRVPGEGGRAQQDFHFVAEGRILQIASDKIGFAGTTINGFKLSVEGWPNCLTFYTLSLKTFTIDEVAEVIGQRIETNEDPIT
jgi:hypothetical protein